MVDLTQFLGKDQRYSLSVSNELVEDAAVRRQQEIEDNRLKRKMTFSLFIFALLIASVVFIGAVYLFITGSPDDKKWASALISAIVSGLLGFLVGQKHKI